MDDKIDLSGTNGKLGSQTVAHDPSNVWWNRWEALKQAMSHLEGLINVVQVVDAPPERESLLRRPTLRVLIQELQKFVGAKDADQTNPDPGPTAGLFVYLYNNLKSGRLLLPDGYPSNYVFRILLDQIGFDNGIIATAAAQRLFANDKMAERFRQADLLAQKAIQPAIAAGLLPEGTIALTFMANGARARVIPYAAVALIAIPFTAAIADEDLLATAHEAGHYVYWHGQFDDSTLDKRLIEAGVPTWCRQWAEEIFADVYGTVVAGAPYALSGQDILLDERPEAFLHDDGEHPVAPLRTRLYGKVLAKKGGDNDIWGPRLKERWLQKEAEIQRRAMADSATEVNTPAKLRQHKHGTAPGKQLLTETMNWQDDNIADTLGVGDWPLDKALTVIYNALAQSKNGSASVLAAAAVNGWLDDSKQYPDNSDVQQLYEGFTNYLKDLDGSISDDVLAADTSSEVRLLKIKKKLLTDAAKVTPSEWEYLISVQGWVTRGPQEQPNPPE